MLYCLYILVTATKTKQNRQINGIYFKEIQSNSIAKLHSLSFFKKTTCSNVFMSVWGGNILNKSLWIPIHTIKKGSRILE